MCTETLTARKDFLFSQFCTSILCRNLLFSPHKLWQPFWWQNQKGNLFINPYWKYCLLYLQVDLVTHHRQLQGLLQDLIDEEFPSLLIEQTLSITPCDHKGMMSCISMQMTYFYKKGIVLMNSLLPDHDTLWMFDTLFSYLLIIIKTRCKKANNVKKIVSKLLPAHGWKQST